MNVLFLTLVGMDDIQERGIYADTLRIFIKEGHHVTVISPIDRRHGKKTYINEAANCRIIRVRTLNIQKTNIIEKTVAISAVDFQLKNAIKKYIDLTKIDLLVYTTPPITLTATIAFCKTTNEKIKTYLLLKDIFPQNAVDIGFISKKSLFYTYFRRKEKLLYELSDRIGCMSPANVDFLLRDNPSLSPAKVEICPNTIEPIPFAPSEQQRLQAKVHFHLPTDRRVFIYGGNLGKPQGVDFILSFLDANKNREDAFFVVIGAGTEYGKLEKWYQLEKPKSVLLLSALPKLEYDKLIQAADIGLIFLDCRFTIPNFPSRLLAYMENAMPVIAATDPHTDLGKIIENGGFGHSVISNDVKELNKLVDKYVSMTKEQIMEIGEISRKYLLENYAADKSFSILKNFVKK